jgi:uncharacterized protein (DUF952 family)/pimeloyl-ACP methyl ester carboxylesterase
VTARIIFHIARRVDWDDAIASGEYRVSTLGRTLDEEGFIHCSASGAQVVNVANSYYRAVEEPLVVLTIATERVPSEIIDEIPDGGSEAFPHIYGPLPVDAVTQARAIPRTGDRHFAWPLEPASVVTPSYASRASHAPASHAFERDGIRIVVHDWGGSGAPVLLAHPTGFHGRVWAPVAPRLVAAGRHVYSFDFRGHGDSDAPEFETESYSWHGFAADVLAVTRYLELARHPDLLACGHSKGGAALLLAEAEAAGTYARIWAYEPIMFPSDIPLPPQEEFGMARAARRRRNEWASLDQVYTAYASKPPLDVMTPESLRAYVDYGMRDRGDGTFVLKCRPDVEARIYAMGPNHGAFGTLHTIASSVRVVCGETSTDISPAFGAQIAARLRHGSLEVMAGCGHFGPQQDPETTVASMLRFAAETSH